VIAPGEQRARLIRTLVVDDEPLARSSITILLRHDPEIQLVGECASGREALAAIRKLRPALVFLDVAMPECDGFDVLVGLGVDVPPAVVFVTAHDGYALRAFEAGALDYLLKPFDAERFGRALQRAKQRVPAKLAAAQARVLAVKSGGGVTFVKLSEIVWIEAADYYVRLHTAAATHLLRRTLSELERELDPAEFCRIHRSVIVSLDRVRRLEPSVGGEYDVLLDDGTRQPLSRRYRKGVAARLKASAR
jgi:two-component system LytT family response regulator